MTSGKVYVVGKLRRNRANWCVEVQWGIKLGMCMVFTLQFNVLCSHNRHKIPNICSKWPTVGKTKVGSVQIVWGTNSHISGPLVFSSPQGCPTVNSTSWTCHEVTEHLLPQTVYLAYPIMVPLSICSVAQPRLLATIFDSVCLCVIKCTSSGQARPRFCYQEEGAWGCVIRWWGRRHIQALSFDYYLSQGCFKPHFTLLVLTYVD